ncbi:MAG TPA: FtsX-like permease family protein [Ignavibacteriaceae bacterium]|nr:FtsX-like permease family protein [Ignavibacteriaceae bacterium]
MLIPKLALKNIRGAGLRTWLNVIALSFAYVAIIFIQGLINGMTHQMESVNIGAQYGGGQYWQKEYDPYDPLTLDDAHSKIPVELQQLVDEKKALSILIRQATIYPQGRMQNALLKGIEIDQNVLSIPTAALVSDDNSIPALIGSRMSKSMGLNKGDFLTVRWRDAQGKFDANEVKIVGIINTAASDIDIGQLWIPLDRMRKMTSMPEEATMIVLEQNSQFNNKISGWQYKNLDFLLKDLRSAMQVEQIGDSIFYIVLLLLAMLAIFDTQILSLYRRRKEMGTLMALGMTRNNLIQLFTLEGAMHAVLAAVVGAIYGAPLFIYLATTGIKMPGGVDEMGFGLGDALFPIFSVGLIIKTLLIVLAITTIVSYIPTRKISRLKPTDALRGKLT